VPNHPRLGLEQTQHLGMHVHAGLVQYAELLALIGADLDAWIHGQLERHPALEVTVPRSCRRCGGMVWQGGRHVCLLAGRWENGPDEGGDGPPDPRVAEALATVAAALGATARAGAMYLLADLDDRGRLDRPLAAVAAGAGCPETLLAAALQVLRGVLGAGLAARDLRESLLLQLAGRPGAPALCAPLVADHLARLADGDLAGVAARTGATVGQVQEAAAWLRGHLDAGSTVGSQPRPAASAVPDLVVVELAGKLVVESVGAAWQATRVAPAYARLAGTDPSVRRAVAAADAVLDRLAGRAATLVRVGQEVVDRQTEYLRRTGPVQALTRAEVAGALRLHESTVSRAVAGTTLMCLGDRVRRLADLFGPPGRTARDLLPVILASGPASDAELAAALTRQGHPTARRTVAKYRAQLGIPAQR
jgi:RNA polymerase sigma-54 factor